MKFTLDVQRESMGEGINVKVVADPGQQITEVKITLDGSTLADDQLATPSVQYERSFDHVGDARSGNEHRLLVTAIDQESKSESAMKIWTDAT
ncbi:MAG TPA: hypothetical protein VKW70_10265 [Terriglobia bacterium]|nr:hypothetical protein [Terriglobia bacterium]